MNTQRCSVLLVDDEPNILKALQRLLRPVGYQIFIAESGAEALEILDQMPIDLIISDMRMPEMDGAILLAAVRQKWPDTMRILLTGHADMTQTIAAINQGEIYRFIAKPWVDHDLLNTVRQALEQQSLRRENNRLLQLTAEQNEALREANSTLEIKVKQRTLELSQLVEFLEMTQKELRESFHSSVQVLTSILEMRFANWTGHGRRVAAIAEALARAANIKTEEVEAVTHAAMLHDIGKVAFPDALLHKPIAAHSKQDRTEFMEYPALGQMALLAIPELNLAGSYIRSQHENFDGTGYPDRLKGEQISVGARILAIAIDYDELQMGVILNQPLSEEHAKLYIRENKNKRYDGDLVQLFFNILEGQRFRPKEVMINSAQLRPGMILSRDLYSASRFLLLAKGRKLDPGIIKHICHFERTEGKPISVYIRQD